MCSTSEATRCAHARLTKHACALHLIRQRFDQTPSIRSSDVPSRWCMLHACKQLIRLRFDQTSPPSRLPLEHAQSCAFYQTLQIRAAPPPARLASRATKAKTAHSTLLVVRAWTPQLSYVPVRKHRTRSRVSSETESRAIESRNGLSTRDGREATGEATRARDQQVWLVSQSSAHEGADSVRRFALLHIYTCMRQTPDERRLSRPHPLIS